MVYALLALPLVEQSQALSLAFFGLGLVLGTSWIVLGGWQGITRWLSTGLRFVLSAPAAIGSELSAAARFSTAHRPETSLTSMVQVWLLPLGFGLVFASLLLSANPMMESWLASISPSHWLSPSAIQRMLFWCGLALVLLLAFPRRGEHARAPQARLHMARACLSLRPRSTLALFAARSSSSTRSSRSKPLRISPISGVVSRSPRG